MLIHKIPKRNNLQNLRERTRRIKSREFTELITTIAVFGIIYIIALGTLYEILLYISNV